MGFSIGDVVAVYGHKAHIRYVGPLPPNPFGKKQKVSQTGFGVEFSDRKLGDNDGSVDGKQYFKCKLGMGLFVTENRARPYDEKDCSATQLQAAWRSYRARQAFQDAAAFNFWNELDAFEEKDALVKNRDVGTPTLNTIKKQIHEQSMVDTLEETNERDQASYLAVPGTDANRGSAPPRSRRRSSTRRSFGRSSVDASSISAENIPDDYAGPRVKWPITREFCLDLVDHYRDNPDVPLPRKYALELIMAITDHYRETMKGAVVEVEIPKKGGSRLVLVGDTHGQLNDVLWIFYKFGPPSATNVYLFNGDIADRGRYAVEIFMMLFAFKLQCPSSVVINRGNHESADMNEVYGFAQEVRQKYGGFMYQKFQEVFHLLPLCVVMEKRVFVVHGGLCRKDNVTLQHIDRLNRQRPCPACPHSFEDTLMFDLLWSDPQHESGRGWSTRGADCIAFGPDITDAFLTKNNLEVCIRSHQVPTNLRGFEPVHDGRCVTLFSASNYCGTTGNFGGVIIFEANLSFEIQEYMAPSLEEIQMLHSETCAATQKVFLQTRIKYLEMQAKRQHRRTAAARMNEQIIEKICKMICEKKTDLWWCFFNMGAESGRVTPAQWREACANVLGRNFPWVYLMKRLHVVEEDGYVYYNEFLNRYRVEFRPPKCKHLNWRRECIARVFESIMSADLSLKETLMLFDRNCDGTVSFREFNELITELDVGLSEPQVRILMRLITASPAFNAAAGSIDVAEFLGRFRVVYSHVINDDKRSVPWLQRALHCIGKAILADKAEAANRHYEQQRQDGNLGPDLNTRRRSSAVRAVALFQKFKDYNEGGDGYLSYADFVTGIKRLTIDEEELGFALTDEHLYKVAEAVDTTGSKRINYLEFLQAFHVVDSNSNNSAAEELWGQICTAIFQHKSSIRRALHQFDPDMTGKVDSEDFRSALVTVNTVLSRTEAPLTEEQIDQLVNTMDLNNEGMVEYEEFLDSFSPVDTFFLQPGGEDEPSKTSNGPQNGKETLEETDASPTDNEVASNSRRFTLSSTLSQSA
ncbi:serine/threonine protein phosphatase [Toxoplasma gondii ME49]|uniref:Serine/threonine-protein phosphatase n=7 Tax=Toxoplasma gondii TaxID=5811 RepID=A0A125YM36_TOXGV|nr:serine/threonine protein phosphatase [Toxoplasma gondii ME49]EPT25249.1 serine/threonine protein phosphatase [Toxoplasma gondii ME49]ESS34550.1 serine/threonine protein phosphatase [Toxoplasma gondii VEG]CEL78701.1 TPA: serine/threonine protein phosphatase 5,putative [Toxoplasma gondii VEG]|eukprot:XP_018635096.1 serine/threonine protein phosphatase [Toxoplasma gondii ME49]